MQHNKFSVHVLVGTIIFLLISVAATENYFLSDLVSSSFSDDIVKFGLRSINRNF
jgi:hypothetical protein